MKTGVFLLLVLFSVLCHATIYQSISPTGNTTFSDVPLTSTTTIKSLSPVNSYTSNSIVPSLPSATPPSNVDGTYTSFSMESPEDGQTFWNQRQIPVVILVTPPLAKSDRIRILVDGVPYQEWQNTTKFFIDDLVRGTHKIQAQLINSHSEIIKSSQGITVYVHYASLEK